MGSSKSTHKPQRERSAFAPRAFAVQAKKAEVLAAEKPDPGDLLDSYFEQRRMHARAADHTEDTHHLQAKSETGQPQEQNDDTNDQGNVVQLVKVGEGFNIVDNSTQANPWIYVSMLELDAPVNVVIGDEGAAPDDYVPFCQFCSVMSVVWLQSETTTFGELDPDIKLAIIGQALENATNEQQVAWGIEMIGGEDFDGDIADIPVGRDILIYGPTHVTAAKRTDAGFTQYEPENGNVQDYTTKGFQQIFGELRLIVSAS